MQVLWERACTRTGYQSRGAIRVQARSHMKPRVISVCLCASGEVAGHLSMEVRRMFQSL